MLANAEDLAHNHRRTLARKDVERSEKDATGAITIEAFYDINVPREPAVFKDPSTASTRLYVNDRGRDLLERLASEAGVTGLECGEPRDY